MEECVLEWWEGVVFPRLQFFQRSESLASLFILLRCEKDWFAPVMQVIVGDTGRVVPLRGFGMAAPVVMLVRSSSMKVL